MIADGGLTRTMLGGWADGAINASSEERRQVLSGYDKRPPRLPQLPNRPLPLLEALKTNNPCWVYNQHPSRSRPPHRRGQRRSARRRRMRAPVRPAAASTMSAGNARAGCAPHPTSARGRERPFC